MLKIYGFARVNKGARGNTRDLRVLWAAEEMGLSYDIVGMDHPNHDLDSPSYRALNPFGQIPTIEDDGVVVTETGAILLYLARKSGKLLPRDLAGEAQVLRWKRIASGSKRPKWGDVRGSNPQPPSSQPGLALCHSQIARNPRPCGARHRGTRDRQSGRNP